MPWDHISPPNIKALTLNRSSYFIFKNSVRLLLSTAIILILNHKTLNYVKKNSSTEPLCRTVKIHITLYHNYAARKFYFKKEQ